MDKRALLIGVGVGAALTFVFDPDRGGRRRALMRDKLIHGVHVSRRAVDATARDAANRARGFMHAATDRVLHRDVDDDTLVERVRARLGRVSSHPHAIDVYAREGRVTLRGSVLANEAQQVINAIHAVRGVKRVVNELDTYRTAAAMPAFAYSRR